MEQLILAIIIVCVILLITAAAWFYQTYCNRQFFHQYIHGLWEGDEEFCKEAGIDGVWVYIGREWRNSPNAYIIMHSGGEVILEKKAKIEARGLWGDSMRPFMHKRREFEFSITEVDPDGDSDSHLGGDRSGVDFDPLSLEKFMPSPMRVTLDLSRGEMLWHHDDVLHAKLYKNNTAASNVI
jgi:hypothetical protein